MDKKLTPKQKQFVREYLIDLNATQAAIRAGYSAKTANEQCARLLANVSIQQAVQNAQSKRAERTEITQDWVLKRLASIVEVPLTELCGWNPSGITLRDSEGMPAEAIASIKKITERMGADGNSSLSVEQYDKMRALELIGRHLGMFSDKIDVEITDKRVVLDV